VETIKLFEAEDWKVLYISKDEDDNFKDVIKERQVKEYGSIEDFFKQLDENPNSDTDKNSDKNIRTSIQKDLSEKSNTINIMLGLNSNIKTENANKEYLKVMKNRESLNAIHLMSFEGDGNPFGKIWNEIVDEIKEKSPFRNFLTYSV